MPINLNKKTTLVSSVTFDSILIYIFPILIAVISMARHLPDRNFDRRNAYDYNVWAFLENRYAQDWMPSGLGSYLNPIVNIPAYLIGSMPIIFSFLFGIILLITYLHFVLKILDSIDEGGILRIKRNRMAFAIISSASPLFLSELGTAMSGYTSSVFVVVGLYFFIKGMQQEKIKCFIISGLLMGLSVHFKLVNAIALVAILPCFVFVNTRRFVSLACFAFGSITTLVIFSPWYLYVYSKFQNPVFPLFNGFFNSPYYPNFNFKDQRWNMDSPEKFLQLVSGLWARINTEIPAFDLRIFLVSSLFIALAANFRVIIPRFKQNKTESLLLLWFFSFAFLWMETSFIARYFMPGELMIVVVFFILVKNLFDSTLFKGNGFLILGILVMSVMHVPNWNTWQEQFLNSNTKISKIDARWQFPEGISVPSNSQILTLGEPISYIFKFFPKDSNFINIGWPKYNSGIEIDPPASIVSSIMKTSSDNFFLTVLALKDPAAEKIANEYLARYKLQVIITSCKSFRTSSEEFMLCNLENR